MCGIAGKFDFAGGIISEETIKRMCDQIIHRGPDAFGFYTGPAIALGERRLSVIDLREEANPPLANEDKSVWIVFNGEIYNFQELRSELARDGHTFRTKSDTEVIVHLYEKYGTECISHLRGMFAFAIWDSKNKRLFAARDRFGKKPFFYTKTKTSFLFGSSISAIVADADVETSPNFEAVDSYLTHQYVPSPLTAFAGIFKLPPAHYLLCDSKGNIRIKRYWAPPFGQTIDASEEEIAAELMRLLRDSVQVRMVADVPLGVFLSGGLDSGTVTALMAMASSRPIKTFSIGFEEEQLSELPYARRVAQMYGTDHHELVVKPRAVDILPFLVKHYSEPFADSSAIPTYYVSRLAREEITVALSGDGGDESFLGYNHYWSTHQWSKADLVPLPLRRVLANIMQTSLGVLPDTNLRSRIARGFRLFGSALPERYRVQLSIVKDEEKRACYTPYFRSLLNGNKEADYLLDLAWDQTMDDLEWMARHDQHYYLPDCLMVKTDVASMANSLEVRCPLLDHKLAEFAATIPSSRKYDGHGGKAILKRALQNLLPEEVIHKPKTGFGVPLAKWFSADLQVFLRSILLDERSANRGLFRPGYMKKLIDEQVTGKRDWSNRLWAFLFLELWFREYVD